MSRLSIATALVAASFASSALADEPLPVETRGAQVIVDPNAQQQQGYDPNYQQQGYDPNYQQQQQVQVIEEPAPVQQGRGFTYGGSLFSPIWLGEPNDFFRPGIGIDLHAGWEIGRGFSIEGHLGFTYNGVRDPAYGSDSLQSIYLGAGLRYSFFGRLAIVPFLQAGLQLNSWSYCYGSSCKGSFDTVNAGVYGGGGLVYEVNQNLSIDFGLNFMMVLGNDGDLFLGFEKMVQPFIGASLYY